MSNDLKNVLVVSHSFAPISNARTIRLANLCSHLTAAGWKVSVLTVNRGDNLSRKSNSKMFGLLKNINIFRTFPGLLYRIASQRAGLNKISSNNNTSKVKRSWNNPLRWWLLHSLIEPSLEWVVFGIPLLIRLLIREKPAVVISSGPPYAGHLLCAIARILGYRFLWIADFGDPLIGGGGLQPSPFWKAFWKKIETNVLKKIDYVSVTTHGTKALLIKNYPFLIPYHIQVMMNGYDPEQYDKNIEISSPPQLTYIGSLYYPRVSVVPFLKAIETARKSSTGFLRNCKLCIVGPVAGQAIKDLNNSTCIELTGQVSFDESIRVMQSAHLLILWGNRGGIQIPGKVFHYIGSGRPIICMVESLNDDLSKLLRSYKGAYVTLNDYDSVLAVLRRIDTELITDTLPTREMTDFIINCSWQKRFCKIEDLMRNT